MRKLMLLILCFFVIKANAQSYNDTIYFDKPIQRNTDTLPAGVDVVDMWGYPFYNGNNLFRLSNPNPVSPAGTYLCNRFRLTYQDEADTTKYGFDDRTLITLPTGHPLGATVKLGKLRQWTFCQVIDYICNTINISNTDTPDIYIAGSLNTGVKTLATATPALLISATDNFFNSGALHYYLTHHQNLTPAGYDAKIVFDFGTRYYNNGQGICSINSDAFVVPANKYDFDLYSIILHELTHALGFFSLVDKNGFTGFNAVYSHYDDHLVNTSCPQANLKIIDNNLNCFETNAGKGCGYANTYQLTCVNKLSYYSSTNTKKYSVYAPGNFEDGSSLSHFNQVLDNASYIMNPFYVMPKRAWDKAETEVLCNLGYSLKASTSFLCNDRYAIGVDDTATINIGGTASVNVILNDYDPDPGQTVLLDSASVNTSSNAGTVSISGNIITFTALKPYCGDVIIRYRPYTRQTGVRGSEATLTIHIRCPNYCMDDPCNLICNGGFEIYSELPSPNNSFDIHPNLMKSVFTPWERSNNVGTPDQYHRFVPQNNQYSYGIPVSWPYHVTPGVETITGPNTGNDAYFAGGILGDANGRWYAEGIKAPLVTKLDSGSTYALTFWARAMSGNSTSKKSKIATYFMDSSNKNIYQYDTVLLQPQQPTMAFGLNNNWTKTTRTFKANGKERYIYAQYDSSTYLNGNNKYAIGDIYWDNFKLARVGTQLSPHISFSSNSPSIGDTVTVTVKVCNVGINTVNNFILKVLNDTAFKTISNNFNNYPYDTVKQPLLQDSCVSISYKVVVTGNIQFNTDYNFCAVITSATDCTAPQGCAALRLKNDADITLLTFNYNCKSYLLRIGNNHATNTAHNIKVLYKRPSCMANATITAHSANSIGSNIINDTIFIGYIPPNQSLNFIIGNPAVLHGVCHNVADLLSMDEVDINGQNNTADYIMRIFYDSLAGKAKSVCIGDSVKLGLLPTQPDYEYYWSSSPAGFASNSAQPVVKPTVTTTYKLMYFVNGCWDSAKVTIKINGALTPISGDNIICIAASAQYSNAARSGKWYIDSMWDGGNATIDSLTGLLQAKLSGKVRIKYVVQGYCNGLNSVVKTVTIAPKPSIILQQAKYSYTFCRDTALTYAIKNAYQYSSYNWYEVANGSTSYLSGDSVLTLAINQSSNGSRVFYAEAYDTNGCYNKTSNRTLTIYPCYSECSQSDPPVTLTNAFNAGGASNKRMKCGDNEIITLPATKSATFNKCELLMGKNSKIVVPYGTSLTLNGCHVYGCDSMWQGIVVQEGGTLTLQQGENYDCLVEDALNAVQVVNTTQTLPTGYTTLLKVSNTIFNRNNVGINFNITNDGLTVNPGAISISNSIFTCRHIPFTSGSAWIKVDSLKNATACTTPAYSYTSLFITSPAYSTTNYGSVLKTSNNYTVKSAMGISIPNRAFITGSLLIGDSNANAYCSKVIFDNMGIGISNSNSALAVRNCVFQNANATGKTLDGKDQQGIGLLATNCGDAQKIDVSNGIQNRFYNNKFGIKTILCSNVNVSNCVFASSQDVANIADTNRQGKWGVFTQGQSYNNISASNNVFINIANPVKVDVSNPVALYNKQTRSININSNLIYDAVPGTTCSSCYVENAITLAGGVALKADSNTAIIISNNQVKNVFNGIMVNALVNKNANTLNNYIYLKRRVSATAKPIAQYGISYTAGTGINVPSQPRNYIRDNTVYGDFAPSSTTNTHNQTGIFTELQYITDVSCNKVDSATHGYRFSNNNSIRFWDNIIKAKNKYGFTLDNKGVIGMIGIAVLSGDVYCRGNNVWDSTNDYWNNQQHYRINMGNYSDATNSKMYVKDGNNSNPLGSQTSLSFGVLYKKDTSLFTNSPNPNKVGMCVRCYGNNTTASYAPQQHQQGDEEIIPEIEVLEGIALEDPTLAETPEDADEIMTKQQALYEILQANPELLENSLVLKQFMADNYYSSLDYAFLTSQAIANSNIPLATALLNTWATDGTPDFNSYNFCLWQYNKLTDSNYQYPMDSVWELANKCPFTNGKVVYAARNLYNATMEQNLVFENACENVSMLGRRTSPAKPVTIRQKVEGIKVYPNPTTGFVYIDLPNQTGSKVCWQIDVVDVMGKSVLQNKLKIKGNKTFIQLKGNRGFYFIKVLNCNTGNLGVEKIILE